MTRIADVERAHQAARRTVATVINDQASVNLAAKLLGHIDPKMTIEMTQFSLTLPLDGRYLFSYA